MCEYDRLCDTLRSEAIINTGVLGGGLAVSPAMICRLATLPNALSGSASRPAAVRMDKLDG